MTATERARIVVRRKPGGYRDRVRSYKVTIDGTERGTLPAGGTVETEVVPGRHEVRVTIDWTGSPVVAVDVPPGGTAELDAEPAGSAIAALWQLWTPHSYIRLEHRV
jgi:hypothetical protein